MKDVLAQFGIHGITSVKELDSGHINKTFLAENSAGKYILQALNSDIFRNPEIIIKNTELICSIFSEDSRIRVPQFLLCDGKIFAEINGKIWRVYRFIEETQSYSAYTHGYAAGYFLYAVNKDSSVVFQTAKALHSFEFSNIPMRNIHGDTKSDNIIFGDIPSVIDLDTAMRGYAAADYGDMIRSVTAKSVEIKTIEEITKGFADGLNGILSADEIGTLYSGIIMIIEELALRYKKGIKNFPNKSAEHCSKRYSELINQLDSIKKHENEIKEIINKCF